MKSDLWVEVRNSEDVSEFLGAWNSYLDNCDTLLYKGCELLPGISVKSLKDRGVVLRYGNGEPPARLEDQETAVVEVTPARPRWECSVAYTPNMGYLFSHKGKLFVDDILPIGEVVILAKKPTMQDVLDHVNSLLEDLVE